ncbi:MAG: hypothetical protein ACK4GN_12560 [Runella sp.]
MIVGLGEKHPKLSVRKRCVLLGLRRETYYAGKHCKPEESRKASDTYLIAQMQALRKEQISWGFELIYYYLRFQKGIIFCKKRGDIASIKVP